MSHISLARAPRAIAVCLSLVSAASAHAAEDASALARALLSKPVVVVHDPIALPGSAPRTPVDAHESARRLLAGRPATVANPSTATTSDLSTSSMAAGQPRTADASDAARRMILGEGS